MQSLVEKLLQIVGMGVLLMFAALFIISKISGKLTRDIDDIVEGMQRTDEASIPARLPRKGEMLSEIDVIAKQYNRTIDDLEKALLREKTEAENSRKAEIRMLEAQINPHFIYNILDTVNWIAIEKDEYDISNAISTLASILRYAISNSDKPVTLRDEVDWLKKYVYLQQFRLKNKFSFEIRTDPEILDVRVHKLIIQPFVENAIVHGFDTRPGGHHHRGQRQGHLAGDPRSPRQRGCEGDPGQGRHRPVKRFPPPAPLLRRAGRGQRAKRAGRGNDRDHPVPDHGFPGGRERFHGTLVYSPFLKKF